MTSWTMVQNGKGKGVRAWFVLDKDKRRILALGGLIFDTWSEAMTYETNANGDGEVKQAPGTFSTETVDGLPIYLPPPRR